MTTITIPTPVIDGAPAVRARPASPVRDVASIAGRALRAVPKELESVIPPIWRQ